MRLLLKHACSIPQNVSSIADFRRSGTLARTNRTTEVVAEIDELMTGAFQQPKTAKSNEDRPRPIAGRQRIADRRDKHVGVF